MTWAPACRRIRTRPTNPSNTLTPTLGHLQLPSLRLHRPWKRSNPLCPRYLACWALPTVKRMDLRPVSFELGRDFQRGLRLCSYNLSSLLLRMSVLTRKSPAAQGTPGQLSPQAATHQSQPQQPQPQSAAPVKNDYRPEPESQAYQPTIVSNPRMTLPPTPPMHPDTVIDGNQSPSVASQSSLSHQQPYYLGQSLNNMEPHQQRQHAAPVVSLPKRQSLPQQPNVSPYAGSQYAASPAYGSSPAQATASGYYSPESAVYPPPSAGMYAQRALPTTFAPQLPMHMVQPPPSTTANPWQHHHYISHSSQAAFPQSNDRYICTTCNKAFSRPSSLRIHSHSHTGEKPYKCPQPGCGKAFSVRSNMKRHERGCHTVSNGITTS